MKVFIGECNSCALNYQHYVIYEALMRDFEITDKVSEADIIVIAETCCATQYGILETIKYIHGIIDNKKAGAKVYLTGCITREFKDDPFLNKVKLWLKENIDYIIPQNQPNLLLQLISKEKYSDRDINEFGFIESHREDLATVYIGNGCLNNCSFCKKTFQNYLLKSADLNEVKDAIDVLNEENYSKVLLKATNICQYGVDNYHEYMLPEIIEYLEGKENIRNVALVGFSFSDAIKNNFDDVLRTSRKITEISGGLESGSDRLLEMIRKGFTSEEIIEFVKRIREIYFKRLRFTIISGFPTETLDDVHKTLDVLKQLNPSIVDICRYINSSFVDSSKFEQLLPEEIQEHTRIYSRVLKKRSVNTLIYYPEYKNNLSVNKER